MGSRGFALHSAADLPRQSSSGRARGRACRRATVDRRLQCQVSANPRHCKCARKPPWQWPLRTLSAGSIRLLAMLINGANGRAGCAVEVRGQLPCTVRMSASSPLASDCRAGAPRRLAPPVPRRALVRALGRATWPVGPRRGHSVSLARSHQTAAHWGARPLPTDLLSCRGARRLSAWLHCLRGL